MVASEMLKYGYHPQIGLGPKTNGIIKPIQLKHQRAQVPVSEQVVDDDIIKGIGTLYVAMIQGEPEMDFKKLTIHDAEPGKVLQNWTIS
ncbi:hypothetical protein CQW23_14449 [Capsicum baccatum]|uniref:G-patch domain-containing protein n=1 Tax=Capsicum baccatum TaxID=33114 RepID=A0A2G2WJ80_CAPBA|nr:hypothetical protein CQW23_14449 [Capsicum baccatum]